MIFTDSFEEINIEKGKEIGNFASSWCASPPYECPQRYSKGDDSKKSVSGISVGINDPWDVDS